MNNAKFSGHYVTPRTQSVRAHALRSHQHTPGIEKEERELEERVNRAARKRVRWKLFRLCKNYIMENSENCKENEKERKEGEERERWKKVKGEERERGEERKVEKGSHKDGRTEREYSPEKTHRKPSQNKKRMAEIEGVRNLK